MLRDHPLLTLLGRRGRGAVVDVLRTTPDQAWTVRDLARAADVPRMAASRAVRELEALGVLDVYRPGRDMVVRWQSASAAAQVLAALDPPDVRAEGIATFAQAYQAPAGATLVQWRQSDDDASDPLVPGRVAVLVRDDEDDAWDRIGPALDAVTQAGWPRPEVAVFQRQALRGDPLGERIRQGWPVPYSSRDSPT